MTSVKNSDKILLECLDDTSSLPALTTMDWYDVLTASINHGITPLLYRRFKKPGACNLVPTDIWRDLEKHYHINLKNNLQTYDQLKRYLVIFSDADIPVVVLKGAHIAESIYNNPGMRSFSDIDLLFRKEDISRAQLLINEVESQNGWISSKIDLHWYIEQFRNAPMDAVWKRTQSTTFSGEKALTLIPEALIVHLSLHVSFHHLYDYFGLRTLYDIKEVINKYESSLDWAEVSKCADEWGTSHSLFLTLLIAKELTGAKVPNEILTILTPPNFDVKAKNWAKKQIFSGVSFNVQVLSPYFWEIVQPSSIAEKINSLKKLLIPSSEFISQKYETVNNTTRNRVFYFVRFKDHFFRYSKAILKILCRSPEMRKHMKKIRRDYQMREWLGS